MEDEYDLEEQNEDGWSDLSQRRFSVSAKAGRKSLTDLYPFETVGEMLDNVLPAASGSLTKVLSVIWNCSVKFHLKQLPGSGVGALPKEPAFKAFKGAIQCLLIYVSTAGKLPDYLETLVSKSTRKQLAALGPDQAYVLLREITCRHQEVVVQLEHEALRLWLESQTIKNDKLCQGLNQYLQSLSEKQKTKLLKHFKVFIEQVARKVRNNGLQPGDTQPARLERTPLKSTRGRRADSESASRISSGSRDQGKPSTSKRSGDGVSGPLSSQRSSHIGQKKTRASEDASVGNEVLEDDDDGEYERDESPALLTTPSQGVKRARVRKVREQKHTAPEQAAKVANIWKRRKEQLTLYQSETALRLLEQNMDDQSELILPHRLRERYPKLAKSFK